MDIAASLLTQTDEPITVIAGKVGYTNTSKFSEAFKKVKGKTPLEYRKIKSKRSKTRLRRVANKLNTCNT